MAQDRTGEGAGGQVPGLDRSTSPRRPADEDAAPAGPEGLRTPGPSGGGFTGPDGADLPSDGPLADAAADLRDREGR